MLTRICLLKPGLPLLMAVVILSGCDRVQSLTKKLKTTREATATASNASATVSSDPVQTLDSSSYAGFVSQKGKLVIVDFYADWCGPCKRMGPVLEKAVAAHPGVVCLGKVNVDQAKQLAAENQVGGIPDVRFFRDGKEVDKVVGFPGETVLMEKITAMSKSIVPAAAPAADGSQAKPAASSEPKIQRMKKDWLPPGIEKR
jgi:thioredoxin 1